ALIAGDGRLAEMDIEPALPLGMGTEPEPAQGRLSPGERLLLYTDGITDSRRPDGEFIDLARIALPIARGDLDAGLDAILAKLRRLIGSDPADDVALLAAEFRP